jgi:hypothetical protein
LQGERPNLGSLLLLGFCSAYQFAGRAITEKRSIARAILAPAYFLRRRTHRRLHTVPSRAMHTPRRDVAADTLAQLGRRRRTQGAKRHYREHHIEQSHDSVPPRTLCVPRPSLHCTAHRLARRQLTEWFHGELIRMDRCSSSLRRSYRCDREEGGRAREPRCWNSLVLEVGRGGWRWARARASWLLGWLAVQQHVRRRRDGPGAL